jgi:hypothetical protein
VTNIKDTLQVIAAIVYTHNVNGNPINKVSQLLSSDLFEVTTKFSVKEFKAAINNGLVSEQVLLDIITKINNKFLVA